MSPRSRSRSRSLDAARSRRLFGVDLGFSVQEIQELKGFQGSFGLCVRVGVEFRADAGVFVDVPQLVTRVPLRARPWSDHIAGV